MIALPILHAAFLLASSAPPAAKPGVAKHLVLEAKTPVPLVTRKELTTKNSRQGDRFELEVRDDVTVGGLTVIPKGSPAYGEIARHSPNGAYGRSGKLELRLLHGTVGGRNIRLDGDERLKGEGAVGAAVITSVMWGLVGAFVSGKSANLPAGTEIVGFVHRDVPLIVLAD